MLDENEVRERLEREAIPNVDHYDVSLRPDSTGEDAAYIYVIVPDEFAKATDFFERAHLIDNRIFDLFDKEFPGYWPYIKFRAVSEMASI